MPDGFSITGVEEITVHGKPRPNLPPEDLDSPAEGLVYLIRKQTRITGATSSG